MTTPSPINSSLSDDALLARIGSGLAQKRVRSDLSQRQLARQAGVGKRTVERLEAGQPTQLSSFLRVLRVLDLLSTLDVLNSESGPSPMQLLQLKEQERKRASNPRSKKRIEAVRPWTWSDQP
ncbi:MAG: helix-turn-helix transcriptional regulator [Methylacidiphilales bacterium]|nr:helix-turn-helix transcriptional regulator [Candidatus Methylacidiphilales bacterium]